MTADQNSETVAYSLRPAVTEVPAQPEAGSQLSPLFELYESVADGRYQITGQVALHPQGLSEVYRVTDWQDRGTDSVALKVFHEPDDAVSRRVSREVQAHILFDGQTGIAAFHDAGQLEKDGQNYRYLATRFAEGGTLADHIKRGSDDVELIQRMAAQILPALGVMHDRGIVHRDVKPENILVDGAGEVFELTDFGIIGRDESRDIGKIALTGEEMPGGSAIEVPADRIAGTVGFIAPESFVEDEPIGPKVDVFAMGVVFFKGMTGRFPFESSSKLHEYWVSVTNESPVPVQSLNRMVPAGLAELTMESLRKDPEDRPRVDELEARLQAV